MPNRVRIEVNQSDLKRLNDITSHLKKIGSNPDAIIRGAVETTADIAERNAKRMGAYDTGRLAHNITVDKSSKGFIIESIAIDPDTGQNYAPIVHNGLGTGRNSRARPYLFEAVRTLPRRIDSAH